MHTSLLLLALAGPAAAPAPQTTATPNWQESYRAACEAGRQQSKPLAVFVGSGPAGWEKVISDGKPTPEAKQLLADNYVCCYLDTATPEGRRLAAAFEIPEGAGLVVSTRDGEGQAFSHRGTMSRAELEGTLQKYGNGRAVRSTETLDRVRTSYYSSPAATYAPASHAAPTYAAPMSYGGFGGGFSGGFGGGRGGC